MFPNRDRRKRSPSRDAPRDPDALRGRSSSHAAARPVNWRAEIPERPWVSGRGQPWAPQGARPRSRTPKQWAATSQGWQAGAWQNGKGWQQSQGGKGSIKGMNYSKKYPGTPWRPAQEHRWNQWKEGSF